MGVTDDGAKYWGSLGTKWLPPDLSGLPRGVPLTLLITTACRCTLSPTLLPCGFHDVYPYPVIVHKMDCFAGDGHVVDEDCFPQYLETIRSVIKKALTLAALTMGFQTLLTAARQQSPMVKTPPATPVTTNDTPADDGMRIISPKKKTPPPPGLSRLATVEERLLRLQTEFTQLAPDLLSTTTCLYQLKDSVG